MPPQAVPKSPVFSSGVLGEWSETTQSMTLSRRPCHSRSWLAASLMGGQHLNSVAPSGTSSTARVRKCGQVSTLIRRPAARAAAIIGSASPDERCNRCTRPPLARAASISVAIASPSTDRGREARKSA